MSNLKPSPAPEASKGQRDRRVSWGNYRVREYLRNDVLEEASSDEQSITYLAPQDSFEGPLDSSEESPQQPEVSTSKSPAEREVPRDQIMITPIRVKKSPGIKPRTSLISKGKVTPMKSFGFSMRRFENLRVPLPRTPQKSVLSESKYSIEARQRLKDFESRLVLLRQDKENLSAFLGRMQTCVELYKNAAETKRAELTQKASHALRVKAEDVRGTKTLIEHMKMVRGWEAAYRTDIEALWHHSYTRHNWQYYSLFHLKTIVGRGPELYVVGEWPESELVSVFRLLWERKQRLFQTAAQLSEDVLGLAQDVIDSVILFMRDFWKVATVFIVEDTQFTDVEMLTIVQTATGRATITTDLSTLRSALDTRRGKMSLLLL